MTRAFGNAKPIKSSQKCGQRLRWGEGGGVKNLDKYVVVAPPLTQHEISDGREKVK